MNKEQLIAIAEKVNKGLVGGWVTDSAYKQGEDLDGTHAREYLESKGFEVLENYDTGRNGLAITSCGIRLSTNGHISRYAKYYGYQSLGTNEDFLKCVGRIRFGKEEFYKNHYTTGGFEGRKFILLDEYAGDMIHEKEL